MIDQARLNLATARLDAWLESLRGTNGRIAYSGPIAHWWQQSLLYTGPGYDWRYEGIVHGYLALWERIGEPSWLQKARRAGEDLLSAQLANGHFPASAFEFNPASSGTPHEAAADLALLELAKNIRRTAEPGWEGFAEAAVRNLQAYYIDKLWDAEARSFRDHPSIPSFVPNKAATTAEAFFAWSELTGEERWGFEYGLPNLERILSHQVRAKGKLQGAIAQNSFGKQVVEKYMPFYIARCIQALVKGYKLSQDVKYLEAAMNAMHFISHQVSEDGSLPAAIYPHNQINRYPTWVAGLGDVLRTADLLHRYGYSGDLHALEACLLDGQDATGGVQTGRGFASQAGGKPGKIPDFRDLLHVAGWCDKAFRWLAGQVSEAALPAAECQPFQAECSLAGRKLIFYEDKERLQATSGGKTVYLWIKGENWAREASPEFWLH